MSILTVDECKNLLGLTDNSYDEQIRILIPYVQRDVVDICNNSFGDTTIYRQSHGSIAFVRGSTVVGTTTPDTITDDDEEFSTIGFRAGMDIFVAGGSNEGLYTLAGVAAGTLTLTSTGELETQDGATHYRDPGDILIARIRWPRPVKVAAAQMVWHLVDKGRQGDVKSESIDDYSVTYAGAAAYPARALAGLAPYRRAVIW